MKKFILLLLVFAVVAACQKTDPIAEMEGEASLKSAFIDPADAPNGFHYNLNIIGVKMAKNANMDTDITKVHGKVIFVGLGTKDGSVTTDILLKEGEDFAVLDKNGTDGEAMFQLPPPGYDPYVVDSVYPEGEEPNTVSDYSVYVRPLGKPGGWATITTCAELVDSTSLVEMIAKPADRKEIMNLMDGAAYCSVEQVGKKITERKKGKSEFINVTAELTSIVFMITLYDDGDIILGTYYVRVPIFDEMIQNEYWKYDNNGLKLLQVRFYWTGTDVSLSDGGWNNLPPED